MNNKHVIKKELKFYSVAPFLGGVVFSILNLQYGNILNDAAMINVNIVGLTLSLIYTTVFMIYTPTHEKGALFKQFAYASAFTFSVLTYVQYEDPKDVIRMRYIQITFFYY
jgi:solute carrier family 50 (sugar transporter)